MNCRFLNRHNVCQMEGESLATGAAFRRGVGVYPCFHRAFEFINTHPSDSYRIKYNLHIKKKCDGVRNNFAFLAKRDMCRLLNSFKMIIPFKYHFRETRNKYIICMTLEGTCYQHKALLMLSRSLFEYPHNLCGFDAIRMRNEKVIDGVDFTKIPLYFLYLTGISSTWAPGDECFIRDTNFVLQTTRELKEHLQRTDIGRISRIWNYNGLRRGRIDEFADTDQINDEELFHSRVRTYIQNYRLSQNA